MARNLGQLKTLLKRYGFDDNDPLADWLNAAKDEVVTYENWRFLHDISQFTLTAGTADLVLTQNTVDRLISVKNVTNLKKVEPKSTLEWESDIEDPTEKGIPEFYVIRYGTLTQATVPGTQFILTFFRVPQLDTLIELNHTIAVPDITVDSAFYALPTRFEMPIVFRAAAIALMTENEEERAQTAQGQFDAAMMRLVVYYSEETGDEPYAVRDVMGYGDC